jgi:hypothetical protein
MRLKHIYTEQLRVRIDIFLYYKITFFSSTSYVGLALINIDNDSRILTFSLTGLAERYNRLFM